MKGSRKRRRIHRFRLGATAGGSCVSDSPSDQALQTCYVPRSMIFVDPGVEGLEWFVGSDLAPWELQMTGRRGGGQCLLDRHQDPPGLALSISPLWSPDTAVSLPSACVFDFYLAFPLLEGHAHGPWLHTTFNRNHGDWVSTEEIRRWAEKGIQTVHCHNDGDYYDDGLFWRDGSYPPYPDMDRFDKVLTDCRQVGIRTATYFSNKELHPSTKEFQEHGEQWGRKNRAGSPAAQLLPPRPRVRCPDVPAVWLARVPQVLHRPGPQESSPRRRLLRLERGPALFESPARSEPRRYLAGHGPLGHRRTAGPDGVDPQSRWHEWPGHRPQHDDSDVRHREFRRRCGVDGMGLPEMDRAVPDLQDLPLESSLAGAIPRGVISYGVLDGNAPRRLHRLFAIEAFLNGVTPWPASEETFALLPLLKPLGEIGNYRFVDWRNQAVTLSDARCAAAVYSRPGEAYVLLANLEADSREVTCVLHPEMLPHPLASPTSATRLAATAARADSLVPSDAASLNVHQLVGEGLQITIPGDDAILIQIR